MTKQLRGWVVAVACVAVTGLATDLAYAQRGPRGGGGRGGGGAVRSAPAVGRAMPRAAAGGYRGGVGYRRSFVGGPLYWGGFGWGAWGPGWGGWGPGWWGPGFAGSMWWPGWGWWGAPALYAPPVGMWGIASDARLIVTPRHTEVYVDGALAGVVDQYDGVFQSLRLAPGTHRITLYLAGHKKWDEHVYVAPGSTLKVRHTMEALPSGAPDEERPTPPARPAPAASPSEDDVDPPAALPRPGSRRGDRRAEPRPLARGAAGTLVIQVQPPDAEVYIDGQRWRSPVGDGPLEVQVPAGRVRVEIRRPGRAPFATEVAVEPGQVTPLNVSLPERGEPL